MCLPYLCIKDMRHIVMYSKNQYESLSVELKMLEDRLASLHCDAFIRSMYRIVIADIESLACCDPRSVPTVMSRISSVMGALDLHYALYGGTMSDDEVRKLLMYGDELFATAMKTGEAAGTRAPVFRRTASRAAAGDGERAGTSQRSSRGRGPGCKCGRLRRMNRLR